MVRGKSNTILAKSRMTAWRKWSFHFQPLILIRTMPSFACFIKGSFLCFKNSMSTFDFLVLHCGLWGTGRRGNTFLEESHDWSEMVHCSVVHDSHVFLSWVFFPLNVGNCFGLNMHFDYTREYFHIFLFQEQNCSPYSEDRPSLTQNWTWGGRSGVCQRSSITLQRPLVLWKITTVASALTHLHPSSCW